jgi:ubiquinone/menaquinone biosynthesis C-methylase UbiE
LTTEDAGYLLDNGQAEAGERFKALSRMFDPNTFRRLEAIGLDAGWHCWEVGAGSVTVPLWLSERVGSTGRVLATDIDLTWLPESSHYETLRHDVGAQAAPGDDFDLIHARMVLSHVPNRDWALESMVAALRPGGWLVIEDVDPQLQPMSRLVENTPEHRRANHLREGFRALLQQRGADTAYGRTLPHRLRQAGLTNVQADAYFTIASPENALLEAATISLLRNDLIALGTATSDEIDGHLHFISSGEDQFATSAIVTSWARKA